MAASSSTPAHCYQIFINHRGVDVKKTFARALYLRLLQNGLKPFLDQDEMRPGYSIPSQINDAITTASVHVAILSPRYAESYWCLKELVLMFETEAPIIPVFYRVTPAEVKWTRGKDGNYARALRKLAKKKTHQKKWRFDSNTIENWRNALSSVADISGLELEVCNGEELELELLDKLVEHLSKMVKMTKPDLHVADYPTGLDFKLKDFEHNVLLQQQQSGKPQVLGIAGLGGVGKTTLAKQFFNKKKSDYHKCCFLDDVKDHAAKGSLHLLQRKLLKDLARLDKPIDNVHEGKQMLIEHFIESSKDLGRSDKSKNSVDEGKEMSIKPLKSSNVLIILDDVNNVDQVEALLPLQTRDLLSGGLILITSRDKGVLKSARVKETSIYTLTVLNTQYSQELFCSYAFSQVSPLQGYEYLTDKFLTSCNGLPLSLKVFGAHLYGKEISEWEDELGRLPTKVKESLKISYDALDHEEQQIFLDIACFLRGQNRDTAISIWNRSGWNGRRGFKNLQDRCLVEVDSRNVMHMHEHLRDLGGDVAEKSEPFRLWRWTHKVVDGLLKQSSNGQVLTVRGLKMDSSEFNEYRQYVFGRIGTMGLRILDTEHDVLERIFGTVESPHMERISRTMEIREILWLRWRKCPYSSLPSWIPLKNLRYLNVSESELITLWESESESQVPFLRAVYLEVLITSSCVKLKSIPGLGYHTRLRLLDISQCSELEELPSMETSTSLEKFYAYGCVKLKSIPALGHCTKLTVLRVYGCSDLEELPSMETLTSLEEFDASDCVKLKSIPALEQCSKLTELRVDGCSDLEELPSMETLASMEEFYAYRCVKLKSIPALGYCTKLRVLSVFGCSDLEELPSMETLTSLEEFYAYGCVKLKSIPALEQCSKLTLLRVDGCSDLEELHSMETLASMEEFYAYGCVKLKSIPALGHCTKLRVLAVNGCSDLEELPSMETLTSLEEFYAYGCVKLKSIPALEQCSKLKLLRVDGCSDLEELPSMETLTSLETFYADGCVKLKSIPAVEHCTKLRVLIVYGCSDLEELPSMETLTSLETFEAHECVKLKSIPALEQCSKLTLLRVDGCSDLEELPSMETLTSLEKFYAYGCVKLKSIPALEHCTKLRVLSVSGCRELEEVEGVEHCTWLEKFKMKACPKLQCPVWE